MLIHWALISGQPKLPLFVDNYYGSNSFWVAKLEHLLLIVLLFPFQEIDYRTNCTCPFCFLVVSGYIQLFKTLEHIQSLESIFLLVEVRLSTYMGLHGQCLNTIHSG